MWASTVTLHDITDAAHTLAKFCDSLRQAHWKALLTVLQYLLRTEQQRVSDSIGEEYRVGGLDMSPYVDFDNATCLDSRRSVSRGVIQLVAASVAWFSKTQQEVALSSSEAEYITLTGIVKDHLYLRQVHQFIAPNEDDVPIQVFEDNQGANQLANNPVSSKGTRHIDVKHQFISDGVLEHKVYTVCIATGDRPVDMLAKPLNAKLLGK